MAKVVWRSASGAEPHAEGNDSGRPLLPGCGRVSEWQGRQGRSCPRMGGAVWARDELCAGVVWDIADFIQEGITTMAKARIWDETSFRASVRSIAGYTVALGLMSGAAALVAWANDDLLGFLKYYSFSSAGLAMACLSVCSMKACRALLGLMRIGSPSVPVESERDACSTPALRITFWVTFSICIVILVVAMVLELQGSRKVAAVCLLLACNVLVVSMAIGGLRRIILVVGHEYLCVNERIAVAPEECPGCEPTDTDSEPLRADEKP